MSAPSMIPASRDGFLFRPPLRGERDYVHVADIVAAIDAAVGDWPNLALRLTAPAACAIAIVAEAKRAPAEQVCGRFQIHFPHPSRYALVRHPDLPADRRVVVDDAAMSAGARIRGRRIDAPPATGFTFVERLTALVVELLLDSDPEDYWRVAELVLTEHPRDDAAIGFEIVSCVARRFWKGVAFADGRAIGHVVLVLAPRPPGDDAPS